MKNRSAQSENTRSAQHPSKRVYYLLIAVFAASLPAYQQSAFADSLHPNSQTRSIDNDAAANKDPTTDIDDMDEFERQATEELAAALKQINTSYIQVVKPIFRRTCFDCHSDQTVFPWYYAIPGIKQFIDEDIEEAREHLDMANDFPFGGHGTPSEDLKDIAKEITEGEMPPFKYLIAHWDANLTDSEKRTVLEWTSKSIKQLE